MICMVTAHNTFYVLRLTKPPAELIAPPKFSAKGGNGDAQFNFDGAKLNLYQTGGAVMNNNPKSTKDNYMSEENNLSQHTTAFLSMLTERGIIEDQQINNDRLRQVEKNKKRNMYHNTMSLLHNYRNIVWVLECFPARIADELDKPMKDLDALLSLISDELDMDNVKLENRLKSIQRSRLLLDRFNEALTILKQKPGNGEMMYKIIYQTYISPEKLTHLDLVYRLDISTRHYYRLRAQAINILSIRLWTAPSAELDSWLEVLTLLEDL